jgi:lipopolysaccharide biosynthesis glycosyltransferase
MILDRLLPKTVTKCIYVDADVFFKCDIADFFKVDLENFHICGARDYTLEKTGYVKNFNLK